MAWVDWFIRIKACFALVILCTHSCEVQSLPLGLFSRVLVMNKLVLIVIIIAFVFIVTYDPKKGKKFLPLEKYQAAPVAQVPECDEKKFLELQGLSGFCAGHNKEYLGAVFDSPLAKRELGPVNGYDLDAINPF